MNKLHITYENQLITRILANEKDYYANANVINENMFFDEKNKAIFNTYFKTVEAGKQPNLARITKALPEFEEHILNLTTKLDYDISLEDIIPELQERYTVSVLKQELTECAALDDSQAILRKLSGAISKANVSGRSEVVTGFEVAIKIIKTLNDPTAQGLPTGFSKFDKLAGLVKSDLGIIAGETSHGKTAIALNIANNLIELDIPTCFISFEMSNEQLMSRMLMLRSGIRKNEIRDKYEQYEMAAGEFSELPFFIGDLNNNNIHNLTATIRSMQIRHNVRVAIIDYLQLVSDSSRRSREEEVGQNARILKNLAKELDITIIALSQLRRTERKEEPTLSRLRDSGQVEEAADWAWLIYRPENHYLDEYDNMPTKDLAVNIIAKGRNYGTGKFYTTFEADTTRFLDGFNPEGTAMAASNKRDFNSKQF